MATTEVGICNDALAEIGEREITSLSNTDKTSKKCNQLYATVRDYMLTSYRWKFAIKRHQQEYLKELLDEDNTIWDLSALGAGIYYLVITSDRFLDNVQKYKHEPMRVYEDGTELTKLDALGSGPTAGEWAWGNAVGDAAVTEDTIYIHLSDSTDPDSHSADENYVSTDQDEPDADYSYYYGIPTDCLRVVDLGTTVFTEFDVEDTRLVTDRGTQIDMKYIAQITDVTLFNSQFERAFTLELARRLNMALTADKALQRELEIFGTQAINDAKRLGAIEAEVRRKYLNTDMLGGRN